jgi:2,4-dienoyl-CoA reductase-like NADH-dependent reductase (Old Yellow Enzyme family)
MRKFLVKVIVKISKDKPPKIVRPSAVKPEQPKISVQKPLTQAEIRQFLREYRGL